jgi:hypothetical protein
VNQKTTFASSALLAALGLGVANFAYQSLVGGDFGVALERTWFQTVACAVVAAVDSIARR